MNISNLMKAGAATLLLAISQAVSAAVVVVSTYDVTNSPYTEGGKLAQKVGSNDSFYNAEWYSDATKTWTSTVASSDIGAQDADNIKTIIGTNLAGTNLALVKQLDSLSGLSGAWTFASSVNWVALHYDNKEAFWFFQSGITAFGMNFIEGNQDISNLRAYSGGSSEFDPLPPVPLPAAAWLFGSALLGLVAVARRRAA